MPLRMNHGQLTRFALQHRQVMASGTIQSARVSFTVVPTASAVGLYLALALTNWCRGSRPTARTASR